MILTVGTVGWHGILVRLTPHRRRFQSVASLVIFKKPLNLVGSRRLPARKEEQKRKVWSGKRVVTGM